MNVAVIGVGNMGKNHARVYSVLDGAKLVAVCDVDPVGKEIAEKYECKYYKDYRVMLEKESLDAVSVCVPTSLHYEVVKELIGRGIHVLVEKPITDSVEEGEKLVKLAREAGVKLAVGHIERFNPAVQKLKEVIEKGKLGKITSMIARRVGLFPSQIKDANVIVDLAVHDIDVFNYLLREGPRKVYAKAGRALINKREDYADILLEYEKASGFIQVNWMTPIKIRTLSISGVKGYAELNYITQELVFYKSVYEKTHDGFDDFVVKFGEPEKENVPVEREEPLKLELRDFLGSIRDNRDPLVTGEDGIVTLRVARAILESSSKGEGVKL